MLDVVGPALPGVKMVRARPQRRTAPALRSGDPRKGTLSCLRSRIGAMVSSAVLKKKYGLQGNKIVFDIKGFFLNEY